MMFPVGIGDVVFIVFICALIWGMTALMNRSRRARPSNEPAVPDSGVGDEPLRELLSAHRRMALVGRFGPGSRERQAVAYLVQNGYEIYPLHPEAEEVEGRKALRRLEDLPAPAGILVIFPPEERVPELVRAAAAGGSAGVWLEKGLRHPAALQIAHQSGLTAVVDHDIVEEHRRLFGKGPNLS